MQIPASTTDTTTPNNAATFPFSARAFALPRTLDSSDSPPRLLHGSLHGAAAVTAQLWAEVADGVWALVGTLTIAAEATLQPVAPNTAGAATAWPGRMAIRLTGAAATAATLRLAASP